jgi:hypothetical protein
VEPRKEEEDRCHEKEGEGEEKKEKKGRRTKEKMEKMRRGIRITGRRR